MNLRPARRVRTRRRIAGSARLAGAAHAVGLMDADAARVRGDAEQAVALIEGWQPPLSAGLESWRPDPAWPMPELPPGCPGYARLPAAPSAVTDMAVRWSPGDCVVLRAVGPLVVGKSASPVGGTGRKRVGRSIFAEADARSATCHAA